MAIFAGRDAYELALMKRLAALRLLKRVMDQLGAGVDKNRLSVEFWAGITGDLQSALTLTLDDVFRATVEEEAQTLAYTFPGELVDEWVRRWVPTYGDQLARSLVRTQQGAIEYYVNQYQSQQWTIGQLRDKLKPVFGPKRAEMIATTEVTRASSQATGAVQDEFRRQNVQTVMVWYTREDELVCPICGKNADQPQGTTWYLPPPAHPRCRCQPQLQIIVPEGA